VCRCSGISPLQTARNATTPPATTAAIPASAVCRTRTAIGGYSHSTTIPPTPDTQHFVFGRRAFFGYLVRASAEIWWFVNLNRPDEPSRAELAGTSTEEWKRRLLDLFAGDLDRISEIIQATHSEIGAYTVHDLSTIPTWHRGPVVLLGDAAHATSPNAGQGASLAMEDALVLAVCLRDIPEVDGALATYERLRRERAEKVVAYSRRLGQSKIISNRLGVWIRDLVLPFAFRRFANPQAHAWLYPSTSTGTTRSPKPVRRSRQRLESSRRRPVGSDPSLRDLFWTW
jgi:FAD-dependent urate hydroxylase